MYTNFVYYPGKGKGESLSPVGCAYENCNGDHSIPKLYTLFQYTCLILSCQILLAEMHSLLVGGAGMYFRLVGGAEMYFLSVSDQRYYP